jgi:release factor glutamine methyltransferase
LERKGIDEARTNAELLLADILNCKRLDLYLQFERPLQEDEKKKYREFISRRSKFEPLQYILGHTEFYGRKFNVYPSVLIPRPETEELIELIIEQNKSGSNLKILDIGTGSGNISITLAKELPGGDVVSIDISDDALETAKENAELNSVDGNLKLLNQSVLDDSIFDIGQFDIIVSNPPYVSKEDFNDLQNEIKKFEPVSAVTDNGDGLKFYKRISSISKDLLEENGKIYFEVGVDMAGNVKQIMEMNGLKNIQIVKDYAGIERIVYGEI